MDRTMWNQFFIPVPSHMGISPTHLDEAMWGLHENRGWNWLGATWTCLAVIINDSLQSAHLSAAYCLVLSWEGLHEETKEEAVCRLFDMHMICYRWASPGASSSVISDIWSQCRKQASLDPDLTHTRWTFPLQSLSGRHFTKNSFHSPCQGEIITSGSEFMLCCALFHPSHLAVAGQQAAKSPKVTHNLLKGFSYNQSCQGLHSTHPCRTTSNWNQPLRRSKRL